MLWYTTDEREARALGASDRALRATTLVIDGQQRLTSLFAVMRGVEIQDKDGEKRSITIAFQPGMDVSKCATPPLGRIRSFCQM